MRHQKKWKGRAHDASAEEAFARALFGEENSHRRPFDAREDRKTQQLCQQVRRSLMLAVMGECHDDALREVYVESVEPIGNSSQLLVRVIVPASAGLPTWDVVARLNARSGQLRAIIARAISRKRVPGLSFMAVPEGRQDREGGAS